MLFLSKKGYLKRAAALLALCMIGASLTGCTGRTDDGQTTSSQTESTSELIELPSFLSGNMGEAKDFLEDNGLSYTIVSEYLDSVEKYTVISQEPKAGSMLAPGSEVKLVVAMGSAEEAPSKAESSKTESKEESSKAESSKAESSKAESSKAASSKAESSKPSSRKVEVPNIVGWQAATAQNTLSALDLYYTGSYEFSDSVPKGEIISQSPKGGTQVEEHSRVTFVISDGPKPAESSAPEASSQAASQPLEAEGGGDRYVGTYTSFRPYVRIEKEGSSGYYINVMWSASAYDGISYELHAVYSPVSDTLEYEDGEAYYYQYNTAGQMVEYSLYDDGYLGYFKLYSHNDLRWSDMEIGINITDSFTRE